MESTRTRELGTGLFIFLGGGLSHLDSFDLKEGAWTPNDFDIRQVTPEIRLPVALKRLELKHHLRAEGTCTVRIPGALP